MAPPVSQYWAPEMVAVYGFGWTLLGFGREMAFVVFRTYAPEQLAKTVLGCC